MDWLFHVFNTDSSAPKGIPDRTWYFKDGIWLSISFVISLNFNLFCWSSLESGARGDKAWLTVNSLMEASTSHGLHFLPELTTPSSSCAPRQPICSGAKHENTRKWRIPSCQAKRQSSFFRKPDFLSCNKSSTALVGAGPHPCGVSPLFHGRNTNSTLGPASPSVFGEFTYLAGLRSLVTSNLHLAEDQM